MFACKIQFFNLYLFQIYNISNFKMITFQKECESFKDRNSLTERISAADSIKSKFPNKVPVIVEKFKKEKSLQSIDKVKYLVPSELTVAQLASIVRNRLRLCQTDSFFLFSESGTTLSMSRTVSELYTTMQDQDGFLYVQYASQETFG